MHIKLDNGLDEFRHGWPWPIFQGHRGQTRYDISKFGREKHDIV